MASDHGLRKENLASTPSAQGGHIVYSRLWWAGLLAAILAATANLMVLFTARELLGIPMMVSMTPGSPELVPLFATPVILGSVVPAIGATILLAILGRFLDHPSRVFQIISAIVLILSFISPWSLPVGVATKVVLSLMHVIAAAVIVGVLTRSSHVPEEAYDA